VLTAENAEERALLKTGRGRSRPLSGCEAPSPAPGPSRGLARP